jgi:tRNA-uridine 2-sulfurtransferase
MNKSQRVLVAMSGGVDSSVSAYLLKQQGYDVVGVSLQLWDYSQNQTSTQKFDTCCSEEDRTDARLAAEVIGIPFYVMDYQKEFKKNVVDPFVTSYLEGKTPNPCVACNTFLKFDLLFERAHRLQCDYIATGHYARITKSSEGYQLLKGIDSLKDQSYFLYHLQQDLMSQILFPVGDLTKEEVRKIAKEANLPNADKKESMEICFVPQNDYAAFIEKRGSQKLTPGKIILSSGEVLAEP